MTWADVDLKARMVTFARMKNGDARTVPMTDTLRELLVSLPRSVDAQLPVLSH
jgi:integrase